MKILVIGSSVVDRTVYTRGLPPANVTTVGHQAELSAGGKGLNQAVGLRRLGLQVKFLTTVGNDTDGRWLARALKLEKLPPPQKVAAPTGFSNLIVDHETGDHVVGTFPGANLKLSTRHLPKRYDFAAGLFQWETPDRVSLQAARQLHRQNKLIVLNPAPAHEGWRLDNWLPLTPLITPNEIEARQLARQKRFSATGAIRSFKKMGLSRGVITLGRKGCVWWDGDHEGTVKACRVKAVDAIGAGDSFNAGLLFALLHHKSMKQACRFATRCAAHTVSHSGTASSLPYFRDVKKYL